jgi:predicted transcriptional regulator
MRINAHLDDQYTEKLEYLKKARRQSTTEVIKQAIDVLYEKTHTQQGDKVKALLESDFIGCAEGPEDLSSNYKHYLAESLTAKHDLD